jgi:hypothetical protein
MEVVKQDSERPEYPRKPKPEHIIKGQILLDHYFSKRS